MRCLFVFMLMFMLLFCASVQPSLYTGSRVNERWQFVMKERNVEEIEVFDESLAIINEPLSILSIEALDISEPIMQGDDNEFYLNHDCEGSFNEYGCVFLDARNHLDDPLLIVYGHHVIDTTLRFSRLIELLEKPCSEVLVTFLEKRWRVVLVMQTSLASGNDLFDPWTVSFVNDDHFQAYVRYLNNLAQASLSVPIEKQLLMLSTCLALHSNERVLVIAMEE